MASLFICCCSEELRPPTARAFTKAVPFCRFLNLGWTDNNDWATYKINVSETGVYNLRTRVSGSNTGVIDFLIDDTSAIIVNTPNTGGWQNWQTVTTQIELTAGEHLLKMDIKDAGFNINWIDISKVGEIQPDNFNIEVVGETCPDKNNGKVIINTNETHNYNVSINGLNHSFTSNKTIEDIAPGTYNMCITITGESFEQCYTIQIPESNLVAGKAMVTSKNTTIEITQGTSPFNVFINDAFVLETKAANINIDVKHGDFIQVKTAKECEGVFSKTINLFSDITAYPNPTTGNFEISFPIKQEQVNVALYTYQSQLISSKIYPVTKEKIQISLEGKAAGMYILKIGLENPMIVKMIKL